MKKLLSLIISAIMLIGAINIPVLAINDEITVYLNSKEIDFDQEPIIENGRTLVPMRAIFEAMGCEVVWHDNLKQIVVWKDDEVLMNLEIDRYYIDIHFGDAIVDLDVPPQIVNGRTLVPLRAISESMGAEVEWIQSTKTVIINSDISCSHSKSSEYLSGDDDWKICRNTGSSSEHSTTYKFDTTCDFCGKVLSSRTATVTEEHKFENDICTDCGYVKSNSSVSNNSCSHKNTHKVCYIDLRTFENIGDEDEHNTIDVFEIICDDCNETVKNGVKETRTQKHTFENGTCIYCGYEQSSSGGAAISKPSSSGSLSDYVDGAFLYINVPAGTSIKVPNTSSGTLKIQMDGVFNAMERKSNGQTNSQQYNSKDKKGAISIGKDSEAVIQNSGYSDLVVSIPAEYGTYNETSEKVYETESVGYGESVKITPNNSQTDAIYFSSQDYEYIQYNESKKILDYSNLKASYSQTLDKARTMILTANTSLEIYYCPATMSCVSSDMDAFDEIEVGSGETVRINATDTSKTMIYTDKSHSFDYVIYGTDGKVKSQKQGVTYEGVTVYKNCYIDFTNTSSSTVTIKVPSVYRSLG